MRASTLLTIVLVCASAAHADVLRYRGEYTFGHEVDIFCPAINSQCYWLKGDTPPHVREELRRLTAANTAKPYLPLCVVIAAAFDRESAREGFSADYDGLITVSKLFGRCDETSIVTHGDLQHHRWMLESINDESIDAGAMEGRIPELDFGEQLTVSGNTGCNRISGQATLEDHYIRFGQLMSTLMSCTTDQNELETTIQQVLSGNETSVTIGNGFLILQSGEVSLRYRLQDWVE